ncbi:Phosphoribosylamine-glycine ligase [Kocuria palustris PEL]|uniref:Multifunctional fusion protein n=1 Tax=Kocuria palustris PEL TaxID=1236550 RepID=M2YFF3_9MICC|nr:phosphoribosylamine--glycine ligase [Kocuria palustris]EME37309.1 Phosphoribosylamine-glycine ligase [Kocuria palustris PEL]
MKILVIGSGGREHAIVRTLLRDPAVREVHAAPGNAGISREVPVHPVDPQDPAAVLALTRTIGADLVVVGPEAPLVVGVADALRAEGIDVFGPSAEAARLEGSKAFAKEVMDKAGVPTAQARTCTTEQQVQDALDAFGAPHVVKDDGLAAGKGVVVTEDRQAAAAHALACLEAGSTVVIEQFLDGPEVSLFVICDGTEAVALTPAQDFKRIFDGDEGPNTGGMGAYTPLPWLPAGFADEVVATVARPVLEEMARRGTPFNGVLFCGLAVTSEGLKVIEFNVRFGDPETQSVLARLVSPLGQLLKAAAQGRLAQEQASPDDGPLPLRWSPSSSVNVVVASAGYPGTVRTGDPITGIEEAEALEGVEVIHAGTAHGTGAQDGAVLSSGGRVLSVVALGDDLAQARARAYQGVELIRLEGSQHRTDIAEGALRAQARAQAEDEAAAPAPAVPTAAAAAQGERRPEHPEFPGHPAPPELPGWRHMYSGKVRELYVPEDEHMAATGASVGDDAEYRAGSVLVLATDRISAFDQVLPTEIPDKGVVLTQLSLWWFEQLSEVPNHLWSTDVPEEVRGRAVICKNLSMFPVECIVRGYLTGSGLKDYRRDGEICGVALPEGLEDGSRLEEPIFTPTGKAEVGEHDLPITFEEMSEGMGTAVSERLRELSLQIYARAEAIARKRGIILADTKLEFGLDSYRGAITLGDEVLTPDSSRFWDAETWQPGRSQPSFDKQYVRDWLHSEASGWNGEGLAPALPADVVEPTRARYIEAFERLTGRSFSPQGPFLEVDAVD